MKMNLKKYNVYKVFIEYCVFSVVFEQIPQFINNGKIPSVGFNLDATTAVLSSNTLPFCISMLTFARIIVIFYSTLFLKEFLMRIFSFLAGLAVGAVAAVAVSKKLNDCGCDCDCDDQEDSSCQVSDETVCDESETEKA